MSLFSSICNNEEEILYCKNSDKVQIQSQQASQLTKTTQLMTEPIWIKSLKNKKINEAIKLLQIHIQTQSIAYCPFYGLGNIEDSIGYYEKREIDWLLEQIPTQSVMNNPLDILSLCYSTLSTQQLAFEWYLKILNKYPQNYRLYFGLGNAYYNAHEYIKAQQCYLKSIKLNSSFDKAYQQLSWIFLYVYKNNRKAYNYACQAFSLNNNNFYAKLIMSSMNISDEDQAFRQLNQIILTHPYYAPTYCALALRKSSNINKYSPTQIKNHIDKALEIYPNFDIPYILMARYLQKTKQSQQAIILLQSRLQQSTRCWLLYNNMGDILYNEGDQKKAFKYYKKVLQSNDKNQHALNMCAKCLLNEQVVNFGQVEDYLQKAIAQNHYDLSLKEKLVYVYCQDNKYFKAFLTALAMLQNYEQENKKGYYTEIANILSLMNYIQGDTTDFQSSIDLIMKSDDPQQMLRKVAKILLTGTTIDLSYYLIKIYLCHYQKEQIYQLAGCYWLAKGNYQQCLRNYYRFFIFKNRTNQLINSNDTNKIIDVCQKLVLAEGIQQLKQFHLLFPLNIEFIIAIGKKYIKMMNYKQAKEYLQHAKSLDPTHQQVEDCFDNKQRIKFGKCSLKMVIQLQIDINQWEDKLEKLLVQV